MVRIDDAVVVKYTKDGHFEILADPDSVLDLRNGKDIDVAGALAVLNIFKDAGAADKASESELIRVFKTDDPVKIAEEIMKNGDFQPTAEQKRKMITVIRKQVIGIVMQNSMDPRTKLPHTRDRIEWAFNEAKVKVDFRPAREQVEGVLKEIRLVLPISFGTSKLQVIVPARYAPSAYGKIRGMGKLLKEQWLGNGSLEVTLEVPSGLKIDIMTELGDLTKGEAMVTEKQV